MIMRSFYSLLVLFLILICFSSFSLSSTSKSLENRLFQDELKAYESLSSDSSDNSNLLVFDPDAIMEAESYSSTATDSSSSSSGEGQLSSSSTASQNIVSSSTADAPVVDSSSSTASMNIPSSSTASSNSSVISSTGASNIVSSSSTASAAVVSSSSTGSNVVLLSSSTASGPINSASSSTGSSPPPPPPSAKQITIYVNASFSVLSSPFWKTNFSNDVGTALGISPTRITNIVILKEGQNNAIQFLIAPLATPSANAPSIENLTASFISQYSDPNSILRSSPTFILVQPLTSIPPTTTTLIQCSNGIYQLVCPIISSSTGAAGDSGRSYDSDKSSGINVNWFYLAAGIAFVLLLIGGIAYYFLQVRTRDRFQSKGEEFRGVELQYEVPYNTSGPQSLGGAEAVGYAEVTLGELEAQQLSGGGRAQRAVSVM